MSLHQLPKRCTISRPETQMFLAATISFQTTRSSLCTFVHSRAWNPTHAATTMLRSHRSDIYQDILAARLLRPILYPRCPSSSVMASSIIQSCPYKNLIVWLAVFPARRSLSPRPLSPSPLSRAAPRPLLRLPNSSARSVHGQDSPSRLRSVVIRKANGQRHAILGVRLRVVLCLFEMWVYERDSGF